MADKWKSDSDEPTVPGTEENIRGVGTEDDDFDEAEELDEDEAEEDEGTSTF